MKLCSDCRKPLSDDMLFCPRCGVKVQAQEDKIPTVVNKYEAELSQKEETSTMPNKYDTQSLQEEAFTTADEFKTQSPQEDEIPAKTKEYETQLSKENKTIFKHWGFWAGILAVLIVIAIIVAGTHPSDDAFTPQEETQNYSQGLAYIVNSDGTCSIIAIGNCTDLDIKIPKYIDGHKVVEIRAGAFKNHSNINNVIIPDTVRIIGNSAFYNCDSLRNVTIGSGVMSICDDAFYDCDLLMNVTIPNGVTNLGVRAFCSCDSITSIIIPDSLTSIGNGAFNGCFQLTNVVIPDNVKVIGSLAFYECRSLTSINFEGTKAQWNAISKGSSWDSYTGKYTVYCTNGNVAK